MAEASHSSNGEAAAEHIPLFRILTPGFTLFALVYLTLLRLPWRMSPYFILDADEAVLGLMARHAAEGAAFPLYFYGQTYGLAALEVLPAALAFRLFGADSVVLSLTILVLFLGGCLAWTVALSRLAGDVAWGRLLALALASLPAWIVWSMKARGLYVSGFLLTGVCLALLAHPDRGRARMVAVGALSGVLFQVQPLWLVAVAPFVFLRNPERGDVARAGLAALLAFALLELPAVGAYDFWRVDGLGGFQLDALHRFPNQVVAMFSGAVDPHPTGWWAAVIGVTAALAFCATLVALPLVWLRRRDRAVLVAGVAAASSLVYVPFLAQIPARYLLPSSVLLFVGAAVWLRASAVEWRGVPRAISLTVVVLLAVGAVRVGWEAPAGVPPWRAEASMLELVDALSARGVGGVYATSAGVAWQLLFYGDERVLARSLGGMDRVPAYPRAVDSLRGAGVPTALVGRIGETIQSGVRIDFGPEHVVADRYFGVMDPDEGVLRRIGFEPAGGGG